MQARGFTLVEMLVVLVILALVMAVVPPLLAGGQAKLELAATAREIAAGLRETRSLAIREGHSEAFLVDGGAGLFRPGAGPMRRLPPGLLLSLTGAGDGRIRNAIRFFADGSSTGGHLLLQCGERRSDVTVDWLTGRVALDAR
jgi:general secretion pathway protein H